jgi:Flp pilus assembly pilin Flp
MVEYGLLGVVLALGAVSGINHLADKVSNAFGRIDNRIDKATQNDGDRDHGGDHGDHGGWGWH